MTKEISSSKTIAKNTLFLYFRMMFTMIVSLYTSRVILQNLGISDYGIYQSVGGIVGMLSFINGALSTGSSRFLTYELGRNNKERLKKTFCTTLLIHIAIAILIVLIAETLGLWFVYNKLTIPADRLGAAITVFHLSILTSIITITQVPYTASIISHERMGIYAYMSIIEVSLKLAIVYLLTISSWDRLEFYAVLLCAVQIGIALFYRLYCIRHFEEARFRVIFDKDIFKSIAGFSGWSLFANIAIALTNQGSTILTNIFFGPSVVTSRAISLQVNMAANQFVNNFRTAANPQIVKLYAKQDFEGSKKLLLSSTKYSFYLMYLLGLPIFLLSEPLLYLWLGQVPAYSVIFLQLVIIQSLFSVFDTSFYTALYAKGRLRENALISPFLLAAQFPIVYVLFKHGLSPVALSWAGLITSVILGVVVKPILLHKVVSYTYKEIMEVFKSCFKVVIVSAPFVTLFDFFMNLECTNILWHFILTILFSILIISVAIYCVGMDKTSRQKVRSFLHYKIYNR